MKQLKVVWIIILSLTALTTFAQTKSFTGCVIYAHNSGAPILSDPIYTDVSGGSGMCNGYPVTYYSSATTALNLENYCSISLLANAATESAANGDPNYRNCSVNGRCGIVRTVTVVECPIDDSAIVLFAVSAVLAFGFIKTSAKFSV